ncbi:MAG: hypothetical protein DUD33_04095 [Coriobacteriaceae bacterium]|nr:MAG: hypothetical protein DUD33_04095 [Coriobacteriaceae bacterium]
MNESNDKYSAAFETYGSLALEPSMNRLILIDGERDSGRNLSGEGTLADDARDHVKNQRIAGRSILAMAVVVVAFVLVTGVAGAILKANVVKSSLDNAKLTTVTVDSGSTVWGYASKCNVKGASTGEIAQWIEDANGIKQGKLVAGESLQLPNFEEQ